MPPRSVSHRLPTAPDTPTNSAATEVDVPARTAAQNLSLTSPEIHTPCGITNTSINEALH